METNEKKQEELNNQEVQEEINPNKITVTLKKPTTINGQKMNELVVDFTDLTGKDILTIDKELRMDGRPGGFDSIYNQDAMLKLAARGVGCIPPDLEKLHGADFFELLLQVRTFFIQW